MRQQTTTLWDERLASEDCSSVRIGIDDAEAGEAEEAARKVACPLFCSLKITSSGFADAAASSHDLVGSSFRETL